MTTIYSFAPIVDSHARVLILGSMPGQASLNAGQYYAHPQNAFWRIMGELLDFDPAITSYAEKTNALKSAGIALWDVLQSCRREGSLDSNIDIKSQVVNDFESFFETHTHIRFVFFNGGKAEDCFQRYVLRDTVLDFVQLFRLPSTSPANATLSFAHKRDKWHQMLMDTLSISQYRSDQLSVR
ncbi:MAG: DNA-deoxyinosine glycosylase [Nitrosomonas sp.]|nr:DNA-deoxyinosine glycosylase [Nitrosomonas sp.]